MVNATAKYVRVSPRKAGDMAAMIRGKKVSEAKAILALSTRAAAKLVGKVLDSAVANAENNNNLDADDLYVVRAYVDGGPTMMPRLRALDPKTAPLSQAEVTALPRIGTAGTVCACLRHAATATVPHYWDEGLGLRT